MRANFDRLAGSYAFIERLVYGRTLERARFAHVPAVVESRDVLIVGEGDGRFLERLIHLLSPVSIDCVEPSASMVARSFKRIAATDRPVRIRFHHRPIDEVELRAEGYDLIVTNFVLDMFQGEELESTLSALNRAARPNASWIISDFQIPSGQSHRLWARPLLWVMYRFFRFTTGLRTARLESPRPVLKSLGWGGVSEETWWRGFIYSSLFRREVAVTSF